MKLIIEIPDHIYEHAKNSTEDGRDERDAIIAIAKGILYEERPRAKIVKDEKGYPMCSRCGEKSSFWNFCQRCGADFREENKNDSDGRLSGTS